MLDTLTFLANLVGSQYVSRPRSPNLLIIVLGLVESISTHPSLVSWLRTLITTDAA